MSMASVLGKMLVAGLVAKGMGKVMGRGGQSGRGAGDILGGLLGGKQGGSGGLGGLLNGLGGGNTSQRGGGIGDILDSFTNNTNQGGQIQPTAEQDHQAEVLLRAMINAIKSDGQIDNAEQERLVKHLGDITDAEMKFVRDEMSAPLDVEAFIRSVPRGMEQQVYLMSLTAIDLDTQSEAKYLHQLAQGLGISQQISNQIHKQVGAPPLYS